jgi:hypothetical protein
MPCNAPPPGCECPWDRVDDCPYGCAADGAEVVLDRRGAATQLCAPARDAGPVAAAGSTAPTPYDGPRCEEGERFSCVGDVVLECRNVPVAIGWCFKGCYADGGSIDDERVSREAAFAIFCSR